MIDTVWVSSIMEALRSLISTQADLPSQVVNVICIAELLRWKAGPIGIDRVF